MIRKKLGWNNRYRWSKDSPFSRGGWDEAVLKGFTRGATAHGLCLANDVAFLGLSGISLVPYIGVEGTSTPYKLLIRDSSGVSTSGFIGAADAAEALGSELLSNPGFETAGAGGADVWANWTETAAGGTFTNETTLVKTGSDAMKNDWDGVTGVRSQLDQHITVTAAKLYKVSFWSRGDGTKAGRWDIYDASASLWIILVTSIGVAGTTYTQVIGYFTAPAGCSDAQIDLYSNETGGIFYIDDVSIKEVTHIGATGAHIVSAKNGSARNWTSIGTGFNYNSTYKIELRRA